MSKLNLHGLTIKDLKKASGDTQDYGNNGCYNEIFYDCATSKVWAKFRVSLGQNSWTVYHDANVIKICNTTRHMTMQELADAIHKAVQMRKEYQGVC